MWYTKLYLESVTMALLWTSIFPFQEYSLPTTDSILRISARFAVTNPFDWRAIYSPTIQLSSFWGHLRFQLRSRRTKYLTPPLSTLWWSEGWSLVCYFLIFFFIHQLNAPDHYLYSFFRTHVACIYPSLSLKSVDLSSGEIFSAVFCSGW